MRLIVTQGAILNFERIIEYLLLKAGETIYVTDIFDTRQDPKKILP